MNQTLLFIPHPSSSSKKVAMLDRVRQMFSTADSDARLQSGWRNYARVAGGIRLLGRRRAADVPHQVSDRRREGGDRQRVPPLHTDVAPYLFPTRGALLGFVDTRGLDERATIRRKTSPASMPRPTSSS
jgi:hypothetical protein